MTIKKRQPQTSLLVSAIASPIPPGCLTYAKAKDLKEDICSNAGLAECPAIAYYKKILRDKFFLVEERTHEAWATRLKGVMAGGQASM